MAEKSFAVNDALSNKLWSARFNREVQNKTYFGRFMGEGEDNIIQVKTETSKAAGDKVTCGLVMSMVGEGRTEGQVLEGYEESLETYDDSFFINELRHATRVKNKKSIDQQRVPLNLRATGRNRLSQWFANRMDTTMFLHLCGYTGDAFTRERQTVDPSKATFNGNNTIVAPHASRILRADNNTTDEAMNSATDDKFQLELVDECIRLAAMADPLIRPVNVDGEDKFVMFLHPSQVKDLRTTVDATKVTWYDVQKARLQGGEGSRNPIFTGALGEYNGVVFHQAFRVTNGVNSSTGAQVANTKRAVFCGAQAGMVGYGRETPKASRYSWVEELFDYKKTLGIGVETIWGLKKSMFNSKDYGSIVVSTYGAD